MQEAKLAIKALSLTVATRTVRGKCCKAAFSNHVSRQLSRTEELTLHGQWFPWQQMRPRFHFAGISGLRTSVLTFKENKLKRRDSKQLLGDVFVVGLSQYYRSLGNDGPCPQKDILLLKPFSFFLLNWSKATIRISGFMIH